MTFSFDDRREKLRACWQAWTANPKDKLSALGANSLYLAVAGSALYPIYYAIAQGDPVAANLLSDLVADAGVNLIANCIQNSADESDAVQKVSAMADKHPEVIESINLIFEKLQVIQQIEHGMSGADREWFSTNLKVELDHVRSRDSKVSVVSNGSGGTGFGQNSTVSGAGGVSVRGDFLGNLYMVKEFPNTSAYHEELPTEITWPERDEKALQLFRGFLNEPDIAESDLLKRLYDWSLVSTAQGGFLTIAGALLFAGNQRVPKGFSTDVLIENRTTGLHRNLNGYCILTLFGLLKSELSGLWSASWEDAGRRDAAGKPLTVQKYPKTAIIEALANFLIHRDYQSNDLGFIIIQPASVELKNPGSSVYTAQELLKAQDSLQPKYTRNQIIIRTLSFIGINQRQGSGLIRIRKALIDNGNVRSNGVASLDIINDIENERFTLKIGVRSMPSVMQEGRALRTTKIQHLRESYLNSLLSKLAENQIVPDDSKRVTALDSASAG